MNVKLNKLFPTLDNHMGKPKQFEIESKNLDLTITGELHKIDHQYCFTQGDGKVVIEQEKAGSIMTWRGTYKKYVVKFIVGDATLAEFDLPEKAKLKLEDITSTS